MNDNIENIYISIDKIILNHMLVNDRAMVLTQSWCYNGFKRMHRVNSKELLCCHIELENNLFDKYRKTLNDTAEIKDYSPTNLRYHLTQWKEMLERDVKELGELNYKHIEMVGISNCVAEKVLKEFLHDYEKACRWLQRFNETGWNPVDMHLVDDRLHEKIKKEEES